MLVTLENREVSNAEIARHICPGDRLSQAFAEGALPRDFGRFGGMGRSRFYSPREVSIIATAWELGRLGVTLNDAFRLSRGTSDPVLLFVADHPGGADFEGLTAKQRKAAMQTLAENLPNWRWVFVPAKAQDAGGDLADAYALKSADDIAKKAASCSGGTICDLREVARRLAARLEAPLYRVSVADGGAEGAA